MRSRGRPTRLSVLSSGLAPAREFMLIIGGPSGRMGGGGQHGAERALDECDFKIIVAVAASSGDDLLAGPAEGRLSRHRANQCFLGAGDAPRLVRQAAES